MATTDDSFINVMASSPPSGLLTPEMVQQIDLATEKVVGKGRRKGRLFLLDLGDFITPASCFFSPSYDDICHEDYNHLNEALAGIGHSWTALTLKLHYALETTAKLVQSANLNIGLLLKKVGMLESILRRGDSAIATSKTMHNTLNKRGPSSGSQNCT
ncbi:hypothetical protein HHK36_007827 [Tetracentron sinense]|uniref:Uncharacterized protein n=1 Tax=Tetracentron sinense TaxID=13715 RepID=A0A834ZHC7_TETSI|nr:hypothetical protein HHK36_007827 [Tetracentron sinense]